LVLLRCHLRAFAAVGELHVRQVCLHLRTDREQEGDASTYMAHTSILAGQMWLSALVGLLPNLHNMQVRCSLHSYTFSIWAAGCHERGVAEGGLHAYSTCRTRGKLVALTCFTAASLSATI
jgi:hypothetical protein